MRKKKSFSVLAIAIVFCFSILMPNMAMADVNVGVLTESASNAFSVGGLATIEQGIVIEGSRSGITSISEKSIIPVSHPVTPDVSSPSFIQNFAQPNGTWNVNRELVTFMVSIQREWTPEQAKVLLKNDVNSESAAVFCFPPSRKVRFLTENEFKEELKKENLIHVGSILTHGGKKTTTKDVFAQGIIDCAKMGGEFMVVLRSDGQSEADASGWHIGFGGVESSVSGDNGNKGSLGVAGTGYGQARNGYVGKPYFEAIALIRKDSLPAKTTETGIINPAIQEKKAPMGMYYDENGNIQFKKAYGAGVF
ncbi:MAG: hypothetical protein Q8N21_04965 [bacterium]|nr:hypothetical protein [bacterium]